MTRAASRWALFSTVLSLLLAGEAAAVGGAPDAAALLAAARQAAREDRNADSAALFERAVAADPAVRSAAAREWADQLSWSGQAKRAIPLFREAIDSGRLAPVDERAARLGLAFALSLGESIGEAEREYRSLLRHDPHDLEAARHLWRVRSWRGRQRESVSRLRELLPGLQGGPAWRFAMFDLARAEYWMGRPDRALMTLEKLASSAPADRSVAELQAEIERGGLPDVRPELVSSSQSDHLDIRSAGVEREQRWRQGMTGLGLRLQHFDYQRAAGDRSAQVERPTLFAHHRLSDATEINANLGLESIRMGRGEVAPRRLAVWDAWFTYWSGDLLRFDLGTKRATFDNLESLARGISTTSYSLSAELVPNDRVKTSLRVETGSFSDGNRRDFGQAEIMVQLRSRPHLLVGARATAFAFSRRFDHGYFNPERFRAVVAVVHGWGSFGHRFWWDVDGTYGREFAVPDGDKPTASGAARLTWEVNDRLALGLRWEYFSSRIASSGGFSRRTSGFFARFSW